MLRSSLIGSVSLTIFLLSCLNPVIALEADNLAEDGIPQYRSAAPARWRLSLGKVLNGKLSLNYQGFSTATLYSGVRYGTRALSYKDTAGKRQVDRWSETSAQFGVRFPFELSRGAYFSSVEIGADAAFTNILSRTHTGSPGNGTFVPLTYSLDYRRFHRSSMDELYPGWGQMVRVSYSHTPAKGAYSGAMLSAQAGFFLPGLFKHHGLDIKFAYEMQEPGNYHFQSKLRFPRGYDHLYQEEIYKASINYGMPLLRPEFGFGPVFHLRHIKADLFYDYVIGRDSHGSVACSSVGVEFSADIGLVKLPVDLDLGTRFSYRLEDNEYRIEPVCFGISF